MEELSNVQITAENILAAILSKTGAIDVSIDDLLADYSDRSIALEQLEDGLFRMELVKTVD